MRAALRDAKIAAAKAAGRVKPVTTLAQRRATRRAEKRRGWTWRTMGILNPSTKFTGTSEKGDRRRAIEAEYRKQTGGEMSGRQFVKIRKYLNRLARHTAEPIQEAA